MRQDLLDQAVQALGANASSVVVDISNYDSVARAAAEVESKLGKIDVLVNSAGIAVRNSPLD